ncbi:MAG: heavy metal response regulator [Candidatus Omnitrophota bacterium]|jgi:heavy metal response regulator
MRILLVEDEAKIASFIKRGLKEERYAVDMAATAEKGLYLSDINSYDLIILDINLPDLDGFSVCKKIRKNSIATPVLMLSARSAVKDRVTGLDSGADDYLSKPFAFEELLARIRSLTRKKTQSYTTVLKVDDLELDRVSHKVKRADREIELTVKEYALLDYFMEHQGQVVTRTMLTEHVWNEDFDSFTNVIDVYVNYLRNKIDKDQKKKLIHTVRGTGYVLKEK